MKRAIGKQLTNWVTCIAKAILIFCIASVVSLVASYFWAKTIISFLLKAFYRPISSPEIASLGAKLGANNRLPDVSSG